MGASKSQPIFVEQSSEGSFIIKWIDDDILNNNRTIEQMKTMFSGNSFFNTAIQSREEYSRKLENLKLYWKSGKFKNTVDFYRAYIILKAPHY